MIAWRRRDAVRAQWRAFEHTLAPSGYLPFGNDTGTIRLFRSATCSLKIEWHSDALWVALAPLNAVSTWIDDDVLREALFDDPGPPDGAQRLWWDPIALGQFLADRTDAMTAALVDPTPAVQDAILRAGTAQHNRWVASLKQKGEAYRPRTAYQALSRPRAIPEAPID